jgi:hypothetical protein
MKAQQELMGIVVIVMIFLVMFVIFTILGSDRDVTIGADFLESNLATATLDSLLDSSVTCEDGLTYRVEGLLQTNSYEDCASLHISAMLEWTFNQLGRGYALNIDGQEYLGSECNPEREIEQAQHDIPLPNGGRRQVVLQIC